MIENKTTLGFWTYIMSDCLLFASLFATYAVLQGNTYGGPSARELFDLPFVLTETLILLTSSFTAGLALLAAHAGKRSQMLAWLGATLVLGVTFIGLEVSEFTALASEGNGWWRSGFLSSYFTLVGTHGAHVAAGSLWLIVLMTQVARTGLTERMMTRLTSWSLFWHFLDVVWIGIFTFVYLFGALM